MSFIEDMMLWVNSYLERQTARQKNPVQMDQMDTLHSSRHRHCATGYNNYENALEHSNRHFQNAT